jgi:hypothetical protein
MNPKILLKSEEDFSKGVCPILYNNVKASVDKILQEDLLEVEGAHFSIETWDTEFSHSYYAFVLHYISPDWQYKKWTVECQSTVGVRNGEASLADAMVGRIPGLSGKSFKVMTTSAADIERDGLAKSAAIDVHLPCLNHVIEVSIEKATEERTIKQIVKKCTDLAAEVQSGFKVLEILQAAEVVGGNQNSL